MNLGQKIRQWLASGKPRSARAEPETEKEPELTPSQERAQWLEEQYRAWQRGELTSDRDRAGPLERAGRW
jgi:hypothetical protein